MKLAHKLMALFLLLAIVPSAVVGYLAYENGRRTIVQETIDHLVSINIFKSSGLKRWVEANKRGVEVLAQRPLVKQNAAVLAKHDIPEPAYRKVKESIVEDHLSPMLKYSDFFELFIMCPRHGLISVSTDEKQEGKYRDTYPYFVEGKTRAYVQGIYYSPALEQPAMTLSTPIKDKQGNLLGVLAGRLDLGELSKIISVRTGKSPTEDTYLVNTFNFFVTEPRFGKGYALKKAVRTEGVAAGLSGKDSVSFYKDYRGEPVIGAYKWLPESNMCIITEVAQVEAFAPVTRLALGITGIVSVISLAAALMGLFFARSITRPVRHLAAGAEEIGGGNLEYRVGTASRDEIGGLSRAFDRMAENLKRITVSRDDLIKEVEKRRQAEESLRAISSRHEAILSAVPDIIMEVDGNKVYTWANQPGIDYFGEDVIGKEAAFYLEGEPETYKAVKPLFDGNEDAVYVESRQRRKDGQERLLAWWCRVLKDEEGNVTGALSSARDITEQKQGEEEIRKLNDELEQRVQERTAQLQAANKELEAFSYSVSHDLRAPLRALDGYSAALLSRYPDKLEEQGKHYLNRIQAASQRMAQLINDLLNLSRVTRCELTARRVDVSSLTREIAAELQGQDPQRKAEFAIDPEMVARGDTHLLRIVLENLLSNAWKFTGPRPVAHIEVRMSDQTGERIYFVRDNGVGFDMAYADKLFIPFHRLHGMREFPGTGIGLATVQRIVTRHGGRVWPEAAVDQGATFFFTLPE